MTRQPRTRWLAGVLYVCAAVLLCPPESSAQYRTVWAPDRAFSGEETAVFARWMGESESPDGLQVHLPAEWDLRHAQVVLPMGVVEPLTVISGPEGSPVNIVGLPDGPYTLILRLDVVGVTGTESWSFVPFMDDGDELAVLDQHRVSQYTIVESAAPSAGRTVLSFLPEDTNRGGSVTAVRETLRSSGDVLLLRNDALPDLGMRSSYTLSFWLESTATNQVILSTWDGNEDTGYPLEITVDAWGHVRYYRGEPGRHQSMVTDRPVADGQWHHIAVTHDADSGWTRLLHDGVAVDSLYSGNPMELAFRTPLAIGARIDGSERERYFTGRLATLQLWPEAHSVETVAAQKRRPQPATRRPSGDAPVFISFEEALPEALVEQPTARARRVPGTFSYDQPLRNLRATVEDQGVRLTWEAEGQTSAAFVVERSDDGVEFDSLAQIPVSARARETSEATEFTYVDNNVREQVVYYRVRQRYEEGHEHLSGSVKLGLGISEDEALSALLGNFPNPFRSDTIIAFELLQRKHVRLSVWDLTGQRIALLLDESIEPGYHEVAFEGQELPSGTYFVRLETTDAQHTHSMVLAK